MKLDTVEKVLDYAIDKEQDAADLYTDLANKMDKEYMKKIFHQFALEEKGHKAKLENVKKGKLELSEPRKIMDLKIAEVVTDVDVDEEFDYQKALIVAMKSEKASYKLYNDLAELAKDEKMKQLFLNLAQEEAKHKMRFEVEYDDYVYAEN